MKHNRVLFLGSLFLVVSCLSGCAFSQEKERPEVTFKNYNQDILYSNTVEYGGTAEYQGPIPTRPSNGEIAYYFVGWDKPLTNIKKNTDFIAQYDTTPNMIQITWNNYDNKEITKSSVLYGQTPTYVGTLPTKPSDDTYDYVFTGWSPEFEPATEPKTYTAVFEPHKKEETDDNVLNLTIFYTVYNPKTNEIASLSPTIPSGLGNVSSSKICQKGADVDLFANPKEGYTFVGWYYEDKVISTNGDYKFRSWDEDVTLEARFQFTMYDLVVSSSRYEFGGIAINNASYSSRASQRMYYTEEVTLYSCNHDDIRFIGWYNEGNTLQSNNAVYTFKMPNKSLELKGKWNKFFITYNLNGGYVNNTLLVESYSYLSASDKYIVLPTPTRTGYIFDGWKDLDKDEFITRVDKSALRDYRVSALWTPITYKIVYNGNGSTSGSSYQATLTYDTNYRIAANNFTKKGYTFVSWNTNPNGNGTTYTVNQSVTNLTSTNNAVINLYAIWQANTYTAYMHNDYEVTVYFEPNNGSERFSQKVNANTPLSYPTVPTRDGYAFKGWYLDKDCTSLYSFSASISQSLVLYAGWQEINVTSYNDLDYVDATKYSSSSSYYSDYLGGTSSSLRNYHYFTALKTTTTYLNYRNSSSGSGYYVYVMIFDVTTGNTAFSNNYVSSTSFSTISFNATAGHVYYLATYRYNTSYSPTFYFYFTGGTSLDSTASGSSSTTYQTITYDSDYRLNSYPSRNGYRFDGWYDANGKKYPDSSSTSSGKWNEDTNKDLYAKWTLIEYTITYELNGGTNSDKNPTKYTVDDYIVFENPEKEGYSFGGWYLESTFETKISEIANGIYYRNLKLYAKWTANTYQAKLHWFSNDSVTLTFVTNGANETVANQTITSTKGAKYPGILTKANYVFKGWYKDSACTQLFDFTSSILEDTTVYAGWEAMSASSYTQRIGIDPSKYTSSSPYSISLSSTSSSYPNYLYFVAQKTGSVDFYYKTSSSSSGYYVYFSIYDVTYGTYLRNNSYISNYDYYSITLSLTAGHTYYIRAYRYNTSYSPTFYFYFSGYELPTAGGTTASVSNVTYDSDFTLPYNTVKRNGYAFAGWYDEEGNQYTDEYGKSISKWTDANDIDLYAKWDIITYTITYHLNGGTNDESNPEAYNVESEITLNDPSKTGYTFDGWYLESTFETKVTDIADGNYYSNLNLYAKWTADTYSLTLDTNGGVFTSFTVSFNANGANTAVSSQTVSAYQSLSNPGTITREGYAFKGWYKDANCTTLFDFTEAVTKDTTVYAGWEEMIGSGYYSRTYLNAWSYTSSSNYYSSSMSYSSSSSAYYFYFTAHTTQSVNFYYRTSSSSSSYYIYYSIVNATTGATLVSNTYMSSSSFYSKSISLVAGNVYYIRAYRYNTSYSPTLYFYFSGITMPSGGGSFDPSVTSEINYNVTYDSNYTLPSNLQKDGYVFDGWFDEEGNRYTDQYGNCVAKWSLTKGIKLVAHWTTA